ncbi:MAG TPA: hypothetical protein VFR68_01110 [Candidatus Dormibacteraeota bacterium]|nr:hypothetical protein [Candidatus Dormibacteraeota bacterium]
MRLRPALGRSLARLASVALLPASVAGLVSISGAAPAAASSGCQLNGPVKHVIYLVFDNTHFRRDRPNVPSDLEQMPHLLNFLTSNGTVLTNDHTILISHTAGGILSSLTGLYPDRQGVTVSNSYGYFPPSQSPAFTTAFKYWTDKVDDSTGTRDQLPNMVTGNPTAPKNTPAPWVPYTRAGCNFGGVSTANIELENTGTGLYGDISEVFGTGSPEWNEANASPVKAQADFVGIAIHCSQGAQLCAHGNSLGLPVGDQLPDEPGGYHGFNGLFGAKYIDPAIHGGNACVNDLNGSPIKDSSGNCGFPGFDRAFPQNSLGFVAQMQEAGVPVTYAYISDAHDNHSLGRASGPGEADYKAQLAAYDRAFQKFFNRLAADGITKDNTLFAVTSDEGDHFTGGTGTPQPDGSLAYSHTACSDLSACPANQIGEVSLNLAKALPSNSPTFSVHSDSAPTFYLKGNPSPTDPQLRAFERTVANLNEVDPYVSASPTPVFVQLADAVGEEALHMTNADPTRTPNFTGFGNPDYFMTASSVGPFCGGNPCVDPGFAWNHGDIQPEIANNWLGLVGPGVKNLGIDSTTWTDHTNVRPTILELAGLTDDYTLDGRVLVEALSSDAVARSLRAHRETLLRLGAAYEQLNASFGQFGMDLLRASTRALHSGSASDDSTYVSIENSIGNLTTQRDDLAGQIKVALNDAAFHGQPLNEGQAKNWIAQAQSLIDDARGLAGS